MHHEHLEILAKHLSQVGLLCLRFTVKTPNFKYRVKCFAAVVVSSLLCKRGKNKRIFFHDVRWSMSSKLPFLTERR